MANQGPEDSPGPAAALANPEERDYGDGFSEEEHRILAQLWRDMIRAGLAHRKTFKDDYEISKKFAYGDHEFMYEDAMPDASFKATVPKVWEFICVLGPLLQWGNPHRNVRVRFEKPEDPRAPFVAVMKDLLNYSVNELNLARPAGEGVDEAFIGRGVMWLEKARHTGLFGHFHDQALNLVVDPDAETMEDAWWIARRHMMPRWEFAGLVRASLDDKDLPSHGRPSILDSAAGAEIVERASDKDGGGELDPRRTGKSNDLLCVYEVWSKMGVGWRAKNVPEALFEKAKRDDQEDYCHFYVVPTSPRLWGYAPEWPVPLWADNDWPCELLWFKKKADYVYPVPLIKPALGLQKAINWIVTFIWQKLRTTSKDFIVVPNELDETVREKVTSGQDLEVIPINSADLQERDINKLVGFLQHPQANPDLWRYLDIVLKLFEQNTGLYAALYAKPGQAEPRSAEASKNREARADIRPDDMREKVEQMHTRMARKEAIAARYFYTPDFVAEILGPEAGQAWGGDAKGDLRRVMREYDYRIEAGSITKPDLRSEKDTALEMFDRMIQLAAPAGDFEAANKLMYNLQRAHNVLEADMVLLNPPPPKPPEEDPAIQEKMRAEAAEADLAEVKVKVEGVKAQMGAKAQEVKMQGDMAKQQMDLAGKQLELKQKAMMGMPQGEVGLRGL